LELEVSLMPFIGLQDRQGASSKQLRAVSPSIGGQTVEASNEIVV